MKRLILGLVCILFSVSILTSCGGVNFKKVYSKMVSENPDFMDTMEISEDGSYLAVDTNPDNIDEYNSIPTYYAIEKLNKEFNLPDSVFLKMGSCTSVQGVQTHIGKSVTASWKYHPDKGLEVIYEKPGK